MSFLACLLPLTASAALGADHPLGVEDCIAAALAHNPELRAARAEASQARAQTSQVQANLFPQLSTLAFVAPMYGATGGLGLSEPFRHDLSEWGPWAHIEARLIQPIYTFGRLSSGITAARERAEVQDARGREIADGVRANVQHLYGSRLYALSMQPCLENARSILDEAVKTAADLYDRATGDVTLPDLMRLRYGAGEIQRYLRQAKDGSELATRALCQAMGLSSDASVEFADNKLPAPSGDVPSLETLVTSARRDRPEFAELAHGRAAVTAWEESERKADLPMLAIALAGQADTSPVRPKGYSATWYNTYNDYFVGGALGLQLNLNPAMSAARAAEASAKGEWVQAEEALADTGIPLQVFKARQALMQNRDLAAVAEEEVRNTQKWMTFAAAAYASGTGEAKDVLEGVAAYAQSKKAYYDHLLGVWQAQADLEQAIGRP